MSSVNCDKALLGYVLVDVTTTDEIDGKMSKLKLWSVILWICYTKEDVPLKTEEYLLETTNA